MKIVHFRKNRREKGQTYKQGKNEQTDSQTGDKSERQRGKKVREERRDKKEEARERERKGGGKTDRQTEMKDIQ